MSKSAPLKSKKGADTGPVRKGGGQKPKGKPSGSIFGSRYGGRHGRVIPV